MRRLHFLILAIFSLGAALEATETYTIDQSKSHVIIHVGKGGIFSFAAGHTHQVVGPISGSIELEADLSQSRVRIAIDTTALKVNPEGEPTGDVPKVQAAMDGEKVLDVVRFPTIKFESTSVAVNARRGDVVELAVTGRLTVRDVTHSTTVPVHVDLGTHALSASGRFAIKQTDYGITPITVAGVVKVQDTLDIRFTIDAHS